ncbi:unnamed protein product [Protopolystoma xenopodis]|uniref:Uncharacterized protein n=1 Tax=Protopolystoma xenopodis TaxID=117903 RepID=A0A448WHP2_9PLAT|nr:unnamed protein product [Protopolystoma xenopodis]
MLPCCHVAVCTDKSSGSPLASSVCLYLTVAACIWTARHTASAVVVLRTGRTLDRDLAA